MDCLWRWITISQCALPIVVLSFLGPARVTPVDIEFSGCLTIQEGAPSPIVATFNATKRAACVLSPITTVTFRVSNPGHPTEDICSQDVSTGATCDSTVKPGGCSCKSKVGDFWTFNLDFNFVPQRHENGTLLLGSDCVPSSTFTASNCEDMKAVPATTGAPNTTEKQSPTSDGLTGPQKAGIAVGCLAGVSGLLLLILTLGKCKGKVLVGHDDEQVRRIDHYVQQLQTHRSTLREIEKKGGCCCCDMPTKLRVDGFRSLDGDGRPRGVQEQLHIAISIRLFFIRRRSMETVKEEVKKFLLEKVTTHRVRIVPCQVDIPRADLDPIQNQMQGANNEDENMRPRIYSAAPNRRDQLVIQIEGLSDEDVERAKVQVKKLIP